MKTKTTSSRTTAPAAGRHFEIAEDLRFFSSALAEFAVTLAEELRHGARVNGPADCVDLARSADPRVRALIKLACRTNRVRKLLTR